MPKSVGCNVDSCVFNNNCRCNAEHIEVTTCKVTTAQNSLETECQTFMPK